MTDPNRDLLEALHADLTKAGAGAFLKLGEANLPDQLYVSMEPDERGRVLHVQLLFLPATMDFPLLQTYVGLPYEVSEQAAPTLFRFLMAANANTPFGEFGYVEAAQLLYYRYNAAVQTDPFDLDLAAYSIAMAGYLVGRLGALIEGVAAGRPFEEARAALEEIVASEVEILRTAE